MKKSIVIAIAMVFAVAANASTASKKAKAPKAPVYTVADSKFDEEGKANCVAVDAYSVAQINVPARVRVIEGNEYSVNVVALDKMAEKSVRYNVKDGVLHVYSVAFDEVENNAIVVNLIVPSAPKIKVAGNLDMLSVR